MNKPSKRPWAIHKGTNEIQDADGDLMCSFIGLDDTDAAYLAHCVNMHDELVEALRTLEFNARMAATFVPHVLLKGAIERADTILKHIDAVAKAEK